MLNYGPCAVRFVLVFVVDFLVLVLVQMEL